MPVMSVLVAIFGLGGWEIVLLVSVILVLFGARRLPELARGLRLGMHEFRNGSRELDQEAMDAGESLGGIYGKPAAEGLTTDNETAEYYDEPWRQPSKNGTAWWKKLWRRVCAVFVRRR